MKQIKDLSWFKDAVAPVLTNYQLNYRFFPNGDFGTLDEVEIDSERLGCVVDFWGLGWLGVFIIDYSTGEELLNVLLETHEEVKKENAFKRLLEILLIYFWG